MRFGLQSKGEDELVPSDEKSTVSKDKPNTKMDTGDKTFDLEAYVELTKQSLFETREYFKETVKIDKDQILKTLTEFEKLMTKFISEIRRFSLGKFFPFTHENKDSLIYLAVKDFSAHVEQLLTKQIGLKLEQLKTLLQNLDSSMSDIFCQTFIGEIERLRQLAGYFQNQLKTAQVEADATVSQLLQDKFVPIPKQQAKEIKQQLDLQQENRQLREKLDTFLHYKGVLEGDLLETTDTLEKLTQENITLQKHFAEITQQHTILMQLYEELSQTWVKLTSTPHSAPGDEKTGKSSVMDERRLLLLKDAELANLRKELDASKKETDHLKRLLMKSNAIKGNAKEGGIIFHHVESTVDELLESSQNKVELLRQWTEVIRAHGEIRETVNQKDAEIERLRIELARLQQKTASPPGIPAPVAPPRAYPRKTSSDDQADWSNAAVLASHSGIGLTPPVPSDTFPAAAPAILEQVVIQQFPRMGLEPS